ncbi:tRNA (guanosine(46)-N7)-methyltransferase TrmB [Mycobacterium sp.]|uniref:tRNA (guanosine(46)-N7)-methyltransferase TrmB n=1 Tax=Mycobacterium sp. TaxID=1785 RepID=UPI00127CF047|nr:tRNA (guanosine(46)-N7)-methyltransferase TrmB [Mycobacterium sp.]KAA8967515.1 MAG: tRNA (guanosine(46)-N7)-methyltransferase TrmB [Mycobacterium sp.]
MGNHGPMHAQPGVHGHPDTDAPTPRGSGGYPRTTSVRPRRSALSAAQQRTWERLWPTLGRTVGSSAEPPLDAGLWFGREAPLVLEIGCGTGTSTLAMAQCEPDVNVVTVDVYRRGLAQLLCAIEREAVGNLRLIRGDAVDVLERLIAPAALTGVRVFFPDPWPKTRHHKRRLLQPATVGLIADRLRPGGVLHVATDHTGYAAQIATVGDAEHRLRRVDPAAQALPISIMRPITKYETKARQAGSSVTELLWERRRP